MNQRLEYRWKYETITTYILNSKMIRTERIFPRFWYARALGNFWQVFMIRAEMSPGGRGGEGSATLSLVTQYPTLYLYVLLIIVNKKYFL
jgi:hypothetical protein